MQFVNNSLNKTVHFATFTISLPSDSGVDFFYKVTINKRINMIYNKSISDTVVHFV